MAHESLIKYDNPIGISTNTIGKKKGKAEKKEVCARVSISHESKVPISFNIIVLHARRRYRRWKAPHPPRIS
jgi:hypothetical protein